MNVECISVFIILRVITVVILINVRRHSDHFIKSPLIFIYQIVGGFETVVLQNILVEEAAVHHIEQVG